ncbi:MmgE/PrpD family protein [Paralcaligenes ginsengisoli]
MSSRLSSAPADPREVCEQAILQLFDWAFSTTPHDIPEEVKRRAVLVLFDDLAAMTGAAAEPEFQRLLPKLGGTGGTPEATIIPVPGRKTDRRNAALINAVATNWLELDEGYRLSPCHAGLYVLPALLADAEADGTSFDDLLHAIVLAYEVVTRVARAFEQRPAVMQSHGRFAAVGAAVAVALNRKLSAQQALNAASAAVTLITPAPRNHLALGALVRNVWAGVGAQSGMAAVEWADGGISGTPSSFYDVYCTVLGGISHEKFLTQELGRSWAILDGYTKMYACCQHLHAAVEATLEIRDQAIQKGVDNITAIEVETHELALPLQNPQPHNTLAAKFSMSHALAAAVVRGNGGADAFSSAMLADEKVNRLRQRVSMAPWPTPIPAPPNDRPARIQMGFADGTQLVAECLSATGGPDRPYADEQRLDKIGALTQSMYPRLRPAADALMTLPAARMRQPWRDIVAAFTAS